MTKGLPATSFIKGFIASSNTATLGTNLSIHEFFEEMETIVREQSSDMQQKVKQNKRKLLFWNILIINLTKSILKAANFERKYVTLYHTTEVST